MPLLSEQLVKPNFKFGGINCDRFIVSYLAVGFKLSLLLLASLAIMLLNELLFPAGEPPAEELTANELPDNGRIRLVWLPVSDTLFPAI